jgi:hypothetical protein
MVPYTNDIHDTIIKQENYKVKKLNQMQVGTKENNGTLTDTTTQKRAQIFKYYQRKTGRMRTKV